MEVQCLKEELSLVKGTERSDQLTVEETQTYAMFLFFLSCTLFWHELLKTTAGLSNVPFVRQSVSTGLLDRLPPLPEDPHLFYAYMLLICAAFPSCPERSIVLTARSCPLGKKKESLS